MLLEVCSAPDNGRQEQSEQHVSITKDKYEHSRWSCDAHRVHADFPVQIFVSRACEQLPTAGHAPSMTSQTLGA